MEKPRRSEALPQTQNQISHGSVANHYGVERFGRIPLRVADALEQGDIDLAEFALLCWFESRANHRKNPPELIATAARIMDAVAWEWSDETLRRKMIHLKDDEWIDYDVKPGSRKPYVIRLLKSRVDGDLEPTSTRPPHELHIGGPPDVELTSTRPVPEEPANPDSSRDRTSKPPPTPTTPQRQRQRADTEPKEQIAEAGESSKGRTNHGSTWEPETLAEDVRAVIEKAKAKQPPPHD
jgi:hypothetical protein